MIVFTRHALERMKQRNITKEEVLAAIRESGAKQDGLGHLVAQREVDARLLRVFYVERDETLVVITAYKTSKNRYKNE